MEENSNHNSPLEQQLIKIKERGYEHFRLEYWRDWNECKGAWQLLVWVGEWKEFKANSPTEAVAKAFLWISEENK